MCFVFGNGQRECAATFEAFFFCEVEVTWGLLVKCRRLMRLSATLHPAMSVEPHAALWSALKIWCGSQVRPLTGVF